MPGIREDKLADTVTYTTRVAGFTLIAVTATLMCRFCKKAKFIEA